MKKDQIKSKEALLAENIQLKKKISILEQSELTRFNWLQKSPVCTKIVDLDFNLKYMSNSGVNDLKIKDITLYYGKPYPLDFYPDTYKITMSDNLKRAKKTGETITLEASIKDLLGNNIWYSSTIIPVYNDLKELDCIMIVSYKTTNQKQSEETLNKYKHIVSYSTDMLAFIDKDYNYVSANNEYLKAFNLSSDKLIGKSVIEVFGEKFFKTVLKPYADRCLKGEQINYQEWFEFAKIGKQYIDFTYYPYHTNDNLISGFVIKGKNITNRKEAENALLQSEATVRNKLKAITDPKGDISTLELSDIIDVDILQSLMDDFYKLTGMLGAVVDLSGKVLVAVGWQDVCTKFHRCNPNSLKNCIESDTILTKGVPEGTFKAYHCKNNMWDIVTPIMVSGRHIGNVFMGQYFLKDEIPDLAFFKEQAKKFGFDEKEYLAAVERTPRFTKEEVNTGMKFYSKLAGIISSLSFSAIQQSRMISEQKITEQALHESKERFELAMNASTDGIYDWNLVTNEIYYSPGWKSMLGYKDHELPNNFLVWQKLTDPDDAAKSWKMQQELINNQRDRFEIEFKMKHKNGHWVDILSRAKIVFDDQKKAIRMIGTHVDISERKHEEKILDIELKLFEYAINHSEEELLQKILDEAELLTNSNIGFYHYIDPNQESISLQTWSTNTIQTMCKQNIESNTHYPLSQAGVWSDCIKERKPVIHNDYLSLSHKKGMPEGHTPVTRELVVPVIRANQVVAVLGVGNKKTDYNEIDIKSVQRLADIAWETAVRKQVEENLKNTFDLSPSIICKGNIFTQHFIEANKAVTRILGYSVEEFFSRNFLDFVYLDDKRRTLNEMFKLRAGEEITFFENRCICKDGTYKWMSWHATKADKNGIVTLVGSDISERKIIEHEIIKTKHFYENIIEGVQDGIWVTDKNDVIFYANKATERIAGVSIDLIKGKNILNDFPLETTGDLIEFYQQAKKEKKPVWYDIKINTLSHKDTWQNGWLIPQYRHKKFTGIICTIRDITQRRQAESVVRKLSTAVQQSPSTITITNTEKIIEYVNPKFTELTGYTSSDAIGKELTILESGKQDANFYKKMWETVASENVWRGQFKNKKKNGEIFWEAASISAILNESGNIINYIKIGEDITAQKHTEAKLKIALEKALESDRLKSAFLANMSHEIRTPMNGILGFINLLNEPNLSNSQIEKYTTIINKSGDRLLKTINDIIDISKIEAGEIVVSSTETCINTEFEELYSFFLPEANQKGVSLFLDPPKSKEPLKIITDSHKLHGILINLIKNAIKFTDEGSVTFGFNLRENAIEFYVKDTGIGIPKDRINAIFNRFEQADIDDKRVFEGSGLGLAISKAYIEMLGGKIYVESEEGKGSTFKFTIPYLKDEKNEIKETFETIENENISTKNLNLLIVEDDEISAVFLETILKNDFRKIFFAENGIEAIELCKNIPDIDLVLMDINMPKMNGYNATKEIRKFNKDIVIIAQTAYVMSGDEQKAIEAGCNDYISKPINRKKLINLLKKTKNKYSL
ncbi:PAS domain S-box protein [Lutibacter sp. HS1-25]|uniref:PAS domain S-box protein n=1 Tax=Lutibacter sp. HS1-25 TaxID=2485000 RepID=UPI001012D01B|nr:PAS domain S-box protein [Lutibacter sp. HS1-25]RXP53646.1 PAS domain S-box protein [Lutibacter sp. HS1-25]